MLNKSEYSDSTVEGRVVTFRSGADVQWTGIYDSGFVTGPYTDLTHLTSPQEQIGSPPHSFLERFDQLFMKLVQAVGFLEFLRVNGGQLIRKAFGLSGRQPGECAAVIIDGRACERPSDLQELQQPFGFLSLVPKLPLGNALFARLCLAMRETPGDSHPVADDLGALRSGASRECVPKQELGNESANRSLGTKVQKLAQIKGRILSEWYPSLAFDFQGPTITNTPQWLNRVVFKCIDDFALVLGKIKYLKDAIARCDEVSAERAEFAIAEWFMQLAYARSTAYSSAMTLHLIDRDD